MEDWTKRLGEAAPPPPSFNKTSQFRDALEEMERETRSSELTPQEQARMAMRERTSQLEGQYAEELRVLGTHGNGHLNGWAILREVGEQPPHGCFYVLQFVNAYVDREGRSMALTPGLLVIDNSARPRFESLRDQIDELSEYARQNDLPPPFSPFVIVDTLSEQLLRDEEERYEATRYQGYDTLDYLLK